MVAFEVITDQRDDPRSHTAADQTGLADEQVDAERVLVRVHLEHLRLFWPREPSVELEVADRCALQLDDAGGRGVLRPSARSIERANLLQIRCRMIRLPPLVHMRLRAPPDDQLIVGIVVEHRADGEVAIGRDLGHRDSVSEVVATVERWRPGEVAREVTTGERRRVDRGDPRRARRRRHRDRDGRATA